MLSAFSCISLYAQATQEGQLGSGLLKSEFAPDPQRQPAAAAASSGEAPQSSSQGEEKQPKRILWIIPNYRAVSADTELPPLSAKGKLWLATEDSFDYSSFVLAGIIAGISQAGNDTPEFHHGAAAYGRYLWHTYTDEVVGNYFTEALLPIATRQDPRYYTLGHSGGGFLHRTGYALTRLVITRTDSGNNTFNVSEVLGNAVGAGISDFYYSLADIPAQFARLPLAAGSLNHEGFRKNQGSWVISDTGFRLLRSPRIRYRLG